MAGPGVVDAYPGGGFQAGAQNIAHLLKEHLLVVDQHAHDLALGDRDANRMQLRRQPGDGHLALMVLGQHEAAQFGAEMAFDAAWQRRDDRAPVRRQPTLPAIAHDMRAKHDVVDDEVLVALEPRTARNRSLEDPVLVDDPPGSPAATASRRLRDGAGRLAFSIPLGLPGLRVGRPLRPFSRAISSRCAMTVRLRSATRSISSTTRAFSAAFGSDSISEGGDIPKRIRNHAAWEAALNAPIQSVAATPTTLSPDFRPVTQCSPSVHLQLFKSGQIGQRWSSSFRRHARP